MAVPRMISSTSAVARWTATDAADLSLMRNALIGRSNTKKSESPIRSARLRSLPRATRSATRVFTIANTYDTMARSPNENAGPPGYAPSRAPAATNRTEATSISTTTGRSAPAITAPLPRGTDGKGFQRRDGVRRDKDAAEICTVVAPTVKIGPTGWDEREARSQA